MDEGRALGMSFALDDFGAGFSSFRNLRELRFDIIKIDGAFIRDIHKEKGNRLMTQAILAVAEHFEMLAVAECVETAAEAEALRHLGIDCMQGWLFGRPAMRPTAPLRLVEAARRARPRGPARGRRNLKPPASAVAAAGPCP